MKEIKFNHNYKKLHNQTYGTLIKMTAHLGCMLHKDFIKYDTDGKYKIEEKEKYLCLYFIGNKKIPFTTLRKCNKANIYKYVGCEGENFKIVVEEKK